MASLPPATGSAASSEHGGVEGEAGHAPAGGLRPHRLQAEPAASGTVGLQHVRGGHRDLALRVLGDDEVEPRAQASAHRGPGGPHRANAAAAGREGPQGSAAPAGEPGGGGRHYEGGARLEGGRVGVPHHALGVAHGRGAVRAAHRRGEAQRQPRLHVVHVAGASRAVSRRPRAINAAPRLRVSCGLGCARGRGAPPTLADRRRRRPMVTRSASAALPDWREGRPAPWACCLKAVAAAAALTAAMSGAGGRASAAAAAEERRFLSTAEAAALERELLEDYRFGRQQLVELCGHASAVAVAKVFPLPAPSRKQRTVLVVCGPEQNGAVGLACARHLRAFEYEPSVFYPTRSLDELHRDLTTQCEKMDIPFLSYLPTEVQLINDAYGLVVDAVLGPGARPGDVGGPCTRALATLKQLSVPLVSLDIPSGTRGAPHPLQCRPRVMGIPRTGRRGSCPQVTRAPATPHAQLECPLPTPGPAARADVSSLSRGRARPGRRPAPAGAIRRHAVGTNSPAPGLRGGGWTPGVSPSLRRLQGQSGLRGEAACPVSERAVWDRVPFSLRVEAGVSEAVGSDGGAGGFHSVTPDSGQRQERRRGP